jgi:hypothetical protein
MTATASGIMLAPGYYQCVFAGSHQLEIAAAVAGGLESLFGRVGIASSLLSLPPAALAKLAHNASCVLRRPFALSLPSTFDQCAT